VGSSASLPGYGGHRRDGEAWQEEEEEEEEEVEEMQ
jgi:hypothetical protein